MQVLFYKSNLLNTIEYLISIRKKYLFYTNKLFKINKFCMLYLKFPKNCVYIIKIIKVEIYYYKL